MISFSEVFMILGLAMILLLWVETMRSQEQARALGLRACRDAGVQLLDDTVALARVRLRRDARGHLAVYREYHFEFTTTGETRHAGEIALLGRRPAHLHLALPDSMTSGTVLEAPVLDATRPDPNRLH
jgi:Protein of unknown function (DUF3301)